MGLFTLPQAMELWIPGVSTTNLSSGDLPVYFPVVTTNAPVSERVPSPLCKAFSIKSAGDKFLYTAVELMIPDFFNPNVFIFIYFPPFTN